jgi:hypothetical protein
LSRIPDAQGKLEIKGTPGIVGMKEWLHQIGHSVCICSGIPVPQSVQGVGLLTNEADRRH